MQSQSLGQVLSEHPFFQGMKPEHQELLAGCARNVRFKLGEHLFQQGEAAAAFYLIRQGKVAIELHGPERGTLILRTAGPGEVLGWSWLVPPYRWLFDGLAMELTRAIALDGECLRNKCERDHDLGYDLLKRFSQNVARQLEAATLQLINIHGPLG
jgi:CRP/FNR family transcriptional regulator, cyclic AMP receptor protein